MNVVRPCRGSCHAVTQRCPAQLGFFCPGGEGELMEGVVDDRAYADGGACNCVPPGNPACAGLAAAAAGAGEVAEA